MSWLVGSKLVSIVLLSLLLSANAPAAGEDDVGFSKPAEAQLEVAKRALDPSVFKLARAERALKSALDQTPISTPQYVRACVMYGVLLLARDDEVKATHWFEKAFHKTLNVSLVSVLGPSVRNYGPKINARFDDIKQEFERTRPALKTDIDFDFDVDQDERDDRDKRDDHPLNTGPGLVERGRLLVEVTDDVGPVRVVIDGREAGETNEVVFAGKIFHYFSVRPPPGKYALQLLAVNSSPSTKFDVIVASRKQTRVHVIAPPPQKAPAPRMLPPAPAPPSEGPNVLAIASLGGGGAAALAAVGLAGVTSFFIVSSDIPDNDRRTLVSSSGIATGIAALGAAVLTTVGLVALALTTDDPPPVAEPVVLPPTPKVIPKAIAEVSEPGGSNEQVALFWKTKI